MDQMSARQLALSYTGMFLGAGFVSGQESVSYTHLTLPTKA